MDFGPRIEKKTILKSETVKDDLLSRWKNRDRKGDMSIIISKAPKDATIPLSYGQKALWFLQDLNKDSSFYNYGESYDLVGDWSIVRLKESLRHICKFNDILRSSCFPSENGSVSARCKTCF